MKCPGQDTQYWTEEAIFEAVCPECGAPMEFFKDDTTRRCGQCSKRIVNPKMDFGCASYCRFAEQCIGTLPEEFVAARTELLKDRLAVAVKKHIGTDFSRIGRISRLARYAEKMARALQEEVPIIVCAAYLLDMKFHTQGLAKGEDGRVTPEALLENLGADPAMIAAVLDLISRCHDTKKPSRRDADILWDAGQLALMSDASGGRDRKEFHFRTPEGQAFARELRVGQQQ